jgi:hypothetical protein
MPIPRAARSGTPWFCFAVRFPCQSLAAPPPPSQEGQSKGQAPGKERRRPRWRAGVREVDLGRRGLEDTASGKPLFHLEHGSDGALTEWYRDAIGNLLPQNSSGRFGDLSHIGAGLQGQPNQSACPVGGTGLHPWDVLQARQHGRAFSASAEALDAPSARPPDLQDEVPASAVRRGGPPLSGTNRRDPLAAPVQGGAPYSQAVRRGAREQKQPTQERCPAMLGRNHLHGAPRSQAPPAG